MAMFDVDENRETTRKVSLSDIAQFCTGSRHLTGYMKGTIQFDYLTDESFGKRIEVNTCSQILTFPVTKRFSTSADLFITNFCDVYTVHQVLGKCKALSFSSNMSKTPSHNIYNM